jgi:hypothetical protein
VVWSMVGGALAALDAYSIEWCCLVVWQSTLLDHHLQSVLTPATAFPLSPLPCQVAVVPQPTCHRGDVSSFQETCPSPPAPAPLPPCTTHAAAAAALYHTAADIIAAASPSPHPPTALPQAAVVPQPTCHGGDVPRPEAPPRGACAHSSCPGRPPPVPGSSPHPGE